MHIGAIFGEVIYWQGVRPEPQKPKVLMKMPQNK